MCHWMLEMQLVCPQILRLACCLNGLQVSPMGLGTWAWGNRFLWNYDPSQDQELQAVWNTAVAAGINLFDTADSYGTGDLNGRSEMLLGQFLRQVAASVGMTT
jgi:pyridoxine 4-dehydrogenase